VSTNPTSRSIPLSAGGGALVGPGAGIDTVLNDLRSRHLDVTRDDVTRVWDALA